MLHTQAQSTRNVPATRLCYNVILQSPLLRDVGTTLVIRLHRSRYTVKTSNQHDASIGNCNFAQKVRCRQTSNPALISRPPPPFATHIATHAVTGTTPPPHLPGLIVLGGSRVLITLSRAHESSR